MTESIDLYDMQDGSGPGREEVSLGDTWRSRRVYCCELCHTATNKWIVGGAYTRGPRLLCPARDHERHEELEALVDRRDELDNRLGRYAGTDEADEVLATLEDERDVVETRLAEVRDWFDGRFDDIEGDPADDGTNWF